MREILLVLLMIGIFILGFYIVGNIGRYMDKHYRGSDSRREVDNRDPDLIDS